MAKSPPPGICLLPINLEEASERNLLIVQRTLCGWKADAIDKWREQIRSGVRTMFWVAKLVTDSSHDNGREHSSSLQALTSNGIHEPAMQRIYRPNTPSVSSAAAANASGETAYLSVGHISLDRRDLDQIPPDLSLADPSLPHPVLTISTLFILPSQARQGLAAFAIAECERLAQQEPYGSLNCAAVTMNTMRRRRYLDDNGILVWERWGVELPPGKWDTGRWYERLGYVPYKEAESTIERGKWLVFYRKELDSTAA